MIASNAALLAAICHANVASCQHWIALSTRMLEHAHGEMRVAMEAFVERPLVVLSVATLQVAAATTRSCLLPTCADSWASGAGYIGRLTQLSCLVAEYVNDMDPWSSQRLAGARSGDGKQALDGLEGSSPTGARRPPTFTGLKRPGPGM